MNNNSNNIPQGLTGSHNTFTYLVPITCPWLRWSARCQSLPVERQGINLADLRVKFHKGSWVVYHGLCIYCSLLSALHVLPATVKSVRIIFAHQKRVPAVAYLALQSVLATNFPHLQFYCGRDKRWKPLTSWPDLPVKQPVGSMQSFYGKLWPWLWWRLHRRKLAQQGLDTHHNYLLDFAGLY